MDEFRDRTQILLSTEAGAEGLNLQFCNLVVNYDLPWNPQRIEQRIGRCHRYGQQRDVLVLNFLNRQNAADARLYELLERKLHLFDGVFGASDEILGALETGVDFERRVLDIYQSCRSTEEIARAFDALREDLEHRIDARMTQARSLLLERFDGEVRRRLRVTGEEAEAAVDRHRRNARTFARQVLGQGRPRPQGERGRRRGPLHSDGRGALAPARRLGPPATAGAAGRRRGLVVRLPVRVDRAARRRSASCTSSCSATATASGCSRRTTERCWPGCPRARGSPGRRRRSRWPRPRSRRWPPRARRCSARPSGETSSSSTGSGSRPTATPRTACSRPAKRWPGRARPGRRRGRGSTGVEDGTERARARAAIERAERDHRRTLAALRAEEETRYALKDRTLAELAARAKVVDRRALVGTAYFWLS